MRAAEVLNRYANGERNCQGANLKGQNFRNQDLSEIDFSCADLRGATFADANLTSVNFSDANLQGVDFSRACLRSANLHGIHCGIPVYWLGILLIAALLVSAYVGFTADSFIKEKEIAFWQVLTMGLAIIGLLLLKLSERYLWKNVLVSILFFTLSSGFLVYLGLGYLVALLLGAILVAILLCTLRIELGLKKYWGVVFLIICVAIFSVICLYKFDLTQTYISWFGFTLQPLIVGLLVNGIKLSPHELSTILRDASFIFSTYAGLGTNFRDADLTDTDFSNANLMHANMRSAMLLRTCWLGVQCIEYSVFDVPIFKDLQVQNLLISGNGNNQNFSNKNLRGAYLKAANLSDASFEGADLSQANLEQANLQNVNFYQANLSNADLSNADLSGAQLVQTQLAEANLTEATLTAACIEDWGITTKTCLKDIHCDYVYMRDMPPGTKEKDRQRKPDDLNQEFQDGDFADFIQPLTDTLDLYHNRDVDPRAIAIAFKKLSDDNPDANLYIVAMESRGEDKFMLRVHTEEQADKSALHAQYTETYNQARSLQPDQDQRLLAEKDKRIADKDNTIKNLTNLLSQAVSRPNTINMSQIQGDNMPNQGNINVGGDMIGNAFGNQNTIDIKQSANLPTPQTVNIHQELVALTQLLTQLQSEDQRKIENALSDAEDELKKPKPDKDEIGQALGRALDYAQKAEGFATSIDKLRPHVQNAAAWLGKNWYKLLAIVGLAA